MQDKYDGSAQIISLRHLINEKYSSVKKLAEQTDAVSIERNLNLFNQMLLNGAILRKEYNKSPKNPKVILDLVSKVLEIISSFGSDGGLGITVYQKMRTIIMSAFVLENFIQQKIRPLTVDEITDGIPSLLFPMINELFRLAEIYCRTVLIGKASIRSGDYVGFQTALKEIPMDERLSIIKLISSENISEYSESTVLDFIKPYDKEFYFKSIPIYRSFLESSEIDKDDKLRIIKFVWIQIYENIHSGGRLFSTSRSQTIKKELLNGAFALLRHVFTHSIEHRQLNEDVRSLVNSPHGATFLTLTLALLEAVSSSLDDATDYSCITRFLKTINDFSGSVLKKFIHPSPAILGFNELLLPTKTEGDTRRIDYLIATLKGRQAAFKEYYDNTLDHNNIIQLAKPYSFLNLSVELQVIFLILLSFIQDFGACYGALLRSEIFEPLNQTATEAGSLEIYGEELELIQDLGVQCIIARNKSVHCGNANFLMNIAVRIYEDGDVVIGYIEQVIAELNANMHVCQTGP